jgi:MFS superfamily sulfate permease-like transporter
MSAFLNTLFVALISWLLFSYFVYLPLAVIAAILINLALGMIDIPLYQRLRQLEKKSFWLVMIVGVLTFVQDPIVGIIFGVIASLLLYLRDVSNGSLMVNVFRNYDFLKRWTIEKYLRKQEQGDIVVVKFPRDLSFVNMSSELEHLEELQ